VLADLRRSATDLEPVPVELHRRRREPRGRM